jgi:hypothetical protein
MWCHVCCGLVGKIEPSLVDLLSFCYVDLL